MSVHDEARALRAKEHGLSSPVPLETMIEEMATIGHPVLIMKNRHGGYSAQRNAYTTERTIEGHTESYLDGAKTIVWRGDTPREAIESLHAAWRERERGNDETN